MPSHTTPVMAGLDPAIHAVPQTEVSASKAFCFAKKKQKTILLLSRLSPPTRAPLKKVFWFFFTKKNCFLCA
jgi:hypothetical protein